MWFLTFLIETYFNPTRLTAAMAASIGSSRTVYVATPIFNPCQGSASSVAYAANDARLMVGIVVAAMAPVLSRSRREIVVIFFSSECVAQPAEVAPLRQRRIGKPRNLGPLALLPPSIFIVSSRRNAT